MPSTVLMNVVPALFWVCLYSVHGFSSALFPVFPSVPLVTGCWEDLSILKMNFVMMNFLDAYEELLAK